MNVINFQIAEPLYKQVEAVIKEKGFASKAEFFRFLTLNYLNTVKKDIDQSTLDKEMTKIIRRLEYCIDTDKIPPLERQMLDV